MTTLGNDSNSKDYWTAQTRPYVDALRNDYHAHRLAVIDSLIPAELYAPARHIFDFGCGDAVHFPKFLRAGADIRGVDIAQEMIALAEERLQGDGYPSGLAVVGDVHALETLPDASLDGLLSFNVLAYLTDAEEAIFYQQAARIVKPGGCLVVTHSNELFDMFSLNRYTVEFFRQHLVSSPDYAERLHTLLVNADAAPTNPLYNVRENPLAYRYKLAGYGFNEMKQAFINRHDAPPALLQGKAYPDTLGLPESEHWKLMFTCSTYGSLSVRM